MICISLTRHSHTRSRCGPGLGAICCSPSRALRCRVGTHLGTDSSAFPQVLKSTGDVAGGRALYEGYAAVTDAPPECFLTLRDTVLLRKESRKLIVQPNTRLEGNGLLSPLWWGLCNPTGVQRRPRTAQGRLPGVTPTSLPATVLPMPNLRPKPWHLPPPPSLLLYTQWRWLSDGNRF